MPFRYLRYNTNANQYNGIRLKVINLLKEILEQKESFYKFKKSLWYLVNSLSQKVTFSDDDINDIVDTILWFYPRPLMLHVIPTLLRQLEVNWKKKSKTNDLIEDKNARNPLPKYLPSASFMDLEISEIDVLFPNNPNKDTESKYIVSTL